MTREMNVLLCQKFLYTVSLYLMSVTAALEQRKPYLKPFLLNFSFVDTSHRVYITLLKELKYIKMIYVHFSG